MGQRWVFNVRAWQWRINGDLLWTSLSSTLDVTCIHTLVHTLMMLMLKIIRLSLPPDSIHNPQEISTPLSDWGSAQKCCYEDHAGCRKNIPSPEISKVIHTVESLGFLFFTELLFKGDKKKCSCLFGCVRFWVVHRQIDLSLLCPVKNVSDLIAYWTLPSELKDSVQASFKMFLMVLNRKAMRNSCIFQVSCKSRSMYPFIFYTR